MYLIFGEWSSRRNSTDIYFYKKLLLLVMVVSLCVSTCGKSFASWRKLSHHQKTCKTCADIVKYRCGTCNEFLAERNRHVKKIRMGARNYMCYICDKRFDKRAECNRHMNIHLDIINFKCEKCDKEFFRFTEAQDHEKICCQNDVSDFESSGDECEMRPCKPVAVPGAAASVGPAEPE